jgi:hypothetical protein
VYPKPLNERGFILPVIDFNNKKHKIAKNVAMIKILLLTTLCILAIGMARQVYLGIDIAKRERRLIRMHRRSGRKYFVVTIVAVTFIESSVGLNGGAEHVDMLFRIHIVVSVLFVVCLALLNWFFTGLNHRRMHKKIAYLSIVLFLVMIGTAVPIIQRL